MRIKVLSIGELINEKTGKGGYFHFTIKYNKDGKEFSRKLVSFGGSLSSYNTLKDALGDEQYDVVLSKDDTGNWQWTSATKVDPTKPEVTVAKNETGKSGNWETTEERARRQVLIVRQSSLAQAVITKGMGEQNADNITELAEKYEAWVMR